MRDLPRHQPAELAPMPIGRKRSESGSDEFAMVSSDLISAGCLPSVSRNASEMRAIG